MMDVKPKPLLFGSVRSVVYTASGRDWGIVGGFDHGMVDAVLANNTVLCLGRRGICRSLW